MNVERSRKTQGAASRSVTIVDVAHHAGVSKSTVSNVLRGVAVTPELEARVRAAIDRLGYTPSFFAQGLAQQQTRCLAALVPQIGNPFYADVLSGMERESVRRDYRLLMASTEDDVRGERRMLGTLLHYRPAGCLVAGLRDTEAAELLVRQRLPAVFLDAHRVPDSSGLLRFDDRLGMRLAVRYLIKLGHTRIASVIDTALDPARDQRLHGYLEALEEAGLRPDPELRLEDRPAPGSREPAPRPAVVDSLLSLKNVPTAVVTGDDLSAIGLIDSLEARGIKVPEDMSVVGFDDIALSGVGRVGLTTVRQPAFAMGVRAAEILINHLEANTAHELGTYRETVDPELVIRTTTAPPPVR